MNDRQQLVLVEDKNGVRTLTLNRPDALNALNKPVARALHQALDRAEEDNAVRCLVITGAGRGFCSGQDVAEAADRLRAGDPIEFRRRLGEHYNPMIARIRTLSKPVVAAVNGVAAGGGCSLAIACDLRIAADTASFMMAFVSVGLIADMGSTFLLPRLVGASRALEMAFTGRKVSADEAFQIGLVNRVVPLDDLQPTVRELTEKLSRMPTRAIGLAKQAFNAGWSADLTTQLDLEAKLQAQAAQTHDHPEGLLAFIEKRTPEFKGA